MNTSVLGLDIGSVSISLVYLALNGEILHGDYRFHRGRVRECLSSMLEDAPARSFEAIACTSSTPRILRAAQVYDTQVCYIEAVRHAHGSIRSLLVVGGEKFLLMSFDHTGAFENLKASTSCAAGTGSFLDQQAGRLGLAGSAELAALALRNSGEAPQIASRCAVFAKTDLCHAQQAGFALEEICDGLCRGLARNIADTVSSAQRLHHPAVIAGGVAQNLAVVRHLEQLLDTCFTAGANAHLYGALGAARCSLKRKRFDRIRFAHPQELFDPGRRKKSYYYEPLHLRLSSYPDFGAVRSNVFTPRISGFPIPVEIDTYADIPPAPVPETFLGIDIGSTSTKAVLIDGGTNVLLGLYTRTAGRPLDAVRALFEALVETLRGQGAEVSLHGVGTTGAGRKFIGAVIGADLILNEITAHARAAIDLDPDIDTIIEIGGQDSKFTTIRHGRVTFSQMNTVCAAGTGSFIEEQAAKLGVGLEEYSRRAENVRAPLASDRCTVFMERDINHYLNNGYTVEEILAAVLFSVRENYLLKVSSQGLIGRRICFQGATAKNRALVAAFEQKLQRPIFVSRYCHLTGALGVALALQENPPARTGFRGLDLYRNAIPVRAETCQLCANHCRLRVAEVGGRTVAYGFLCGRDYEDERYVSKNTSGFDMLREHGRCFEGGCADKRSGSRAVAGHTVGIPAALHLFEHLPLWKRFFSELGFTVVSSEAYTGAVKAGKRLTGAEFCAPVTALHGHARHLAENCDYVFLPVYLQSASGKRVNAQMRHYCYYTQFAPSLISQLQTGGLERKTLTPLIDHRSIEIASTPSQRTARNRSKRELLRALERIEGLDLSYNRVSRAYDRATAAYREGRERLRGVYRSKGAAGREIAVVLTGRPYLVLSREMNKGIPDIFASLGIKTFFQDMISPNAPRSETIREVQPLLDAVHWSYAARILETAAFCATAEGLYPVLITAFKCSPDSIVIEYFKRILDAHEKPYLILQIDEHDSSVGYETRIEAGIHSFRNHAARPRKHSRGTGVTPLPIHPVLETGLNGKILLLPNWDRLTVPLLAAALRGTGVDARPLEEDELSIREGSRFNSGQCLPMNAIVQGTVRYVDSHGLDPARTVLWMIKSDWTCNLHLFPHYMKSLLERYGRGMERVGVYAGDISHTEIAPRLGVDAYFAHLFGGLLRRLGCRIRPYEEQPGRTDCALTRAQAIFIESFANGRSRTDAFAEVIRLFSSIPVSGRRRPKVAIFGDFYVRDNEVMNQDLVRFIEAQGAEVVTTPFSEYLRITASAVFKRWRSQNRYDLLAKYHTLLVLVKVLERRFFSEEGGLPGPQPCFRNRHPEATLQRYNVRLEHHGESWDNLLKIAHLVEHVPDLRLFVQTNPAFCCPSLVTEAMSRRIEQITGIPVVTLTYDGTGSFKNDKIVPYLAAVQQQPQDRALSVCGETKAALPHG